MKRTSISMLVSLVSVLSLAGCAVTPTQDGEIEDDDRDDEASSPSSNTEDSEADDTGNGPDPEDTPPDAPPSNDAPTSNGQHTTEAAACTAIAKAQGSMIDELGCSMTARTCPSLLRVMTGEVCVEYDEGSVMGCIKLYEGAQSCTHLQSLIDTCQVEFFPGTQSADCS